MDINYQEIINFLTQYFYVCGPIAIIFAICGTLANTFVSFVRGDRRVRL